MKKIIGASFVTALLLLNGCTWQKKLSELEELVKKLQTRIEALEKIVMPEKAPAQQYTVPLDDSPVLGNKDAKIHIMVFSNFQCPYCGRADKALREIVKDDGLKDKVNVVFKHFPFPRHVQARPAAKAALAAGEQGKFWEMAEVIFAHQEDLGKPDFKEGEFEKWAKEIGLDVARFKKDLLDHGRKSDDPKAEPSKYDKMIDRDMKEGEKDAKLEGTPWILVNGWLLDGDINAATIKKMIEEKKM